MREIAPVTRTMETESAHVEAEAVAVSAPRRIEKLLEENFKFIPSAVYRRKNVEQELFDFQSAPELPRTRWYQPTREEAPETVIRNAPQLMSAEEEQLMFYRYNYCKVRLATLKRTIKAEGVTPELERQFLEWHHKLEYFREYLVRTNLALVLAMAKRTRLGELDFAEVVSEGNMALLRAIEKFNVERGFKFSTYACRAILKAFSRTASKANRHRARFPVEFEPEMEKSDWQDRRRDAVQDECIDELRAIVEGNLADLSSIEQTVIRRRFNWKQVDEAPLTLEEVGRIIGVTKERVRQIQNKALTKIRVVMEDGVLRSRSRTSPADPFPPIPLVQVPPPFPGSKILEPEEPAESAD
jgi:RNA polymerase sigma factor (sigma-70 family)